MVIISETEYKMLKEKMKQEIIAEMENDKKVSLNTIGQKAYKDIFNQYFPEGSIHNFRRARIQQALCTTNNVLRLRTDVNRKYVQGRDTGIRNEAKLQNAIDTYEELCKTFKVLLREDVYRD